MPYTRAYQFDLSGGLNYPISLLIGDNTPTVIDYLKFQPIRIEGAKGTSIKVNEKDTPTLYRRLYSLFTKFDFGLDLSIVVKDAYPTADQIKKFEEDSSGNPVKFNEILTEWLKARVGYKIDAQSFLSQPIDTEDGASFLLQWDAINDKYDLSQCSRFVIEFWCTSLPTKGDLPITGVMVDQEGPDLSRTTPFAWLDRSGREITTWLRPGEIHTIQPNAMTGARGTVTLLA